MSEIEQEQVPDTAPEVEPDEAPDDAGAPHGEDEFEEEEHEHEQQESEQVEGVPPEAQAVSQKQIEQVWKKFEKSSAVWRKRVAEIMGGDEEVLIPCPMCDVLIPGYVMPSPDVPERFPAVREFMGDAVPEAWQQDPNTRTCQTCNGLGMVATGSKVEGQAQLVCTDCGGKGWQGSRAPVASTGPLASQPLPDANGRDEVTPQGPEPPEAAKLRSLGYVIIQPVGTGG